MKRTRSLGTFVAAAAVTACALAPGAGTPAPSGAPAGLRDAALTATGSAPRSGASAAAPASAEATPPREPRDSGSTAGGQIVAVVRAHGVRRCGPSGEERWTDRTYLLDWTPIVAGPDAGLAVRAARGKVVLADVVRTDEPPTRFDGEPHPAREVPCPLSQLREDWVETPEGIRVAGTPAYGTDSARVLAVRLATPIALERSGDELVVRVQNLLGSPIESPSVLAHYEGCGGKPGRRSDARRLGPFFPGEEAEQRFPVRRPLEGGGQERLAAVALRGRSRNMLDVLAVEVTLPELGAAPVDCAGPTAP